jgi:protein-S-isoprenylcysteine O-methyltransferase Ste14
MRSLFETALLLFALSLAVASLIVVPALLCNLIDSTLVWVAFALYFVFFLSTIGRVRKHGRFTPRQRDAQVKSVYGTIAYPIQFLGLGGAHWLAIYEYSLSEAPQWVWSGAGLVLMLAAMVINRLAAKELGRFWDRLVIQDEHRLVTSGIYSVVRHPIYTSYILLFFGHMILFQSVWATLLLGAVCTLWFGIRIRIEEAMLLQQFGEEYERYMRQTKRLVPFSFLNS